MCQTRAPTGTTQTVLHCFVDPPHFIVYLSPKSNVPQAEAHELWPFSRPERQSRRATGNCQCFILLCSSLTSMQYAFPKEFYLDHTNSFIVLDISQTCTDFVRLRLLSLFCLQSIRQTFPTVHNQSRNHANNCVRICRMPLSFLGLFLLHPSLSPLSFLFPLYTQHLTSYIYLAPTSLQSLQPAFLSNLGLAKEDENRTRTKRISRTANGLPIDARQVLVFKYSFLSGQSLPWRRV